MKITGNTVLVTGGASGIGLSIAGSFLENMNNVIICGRNNDKLNRIKKQYPGIRSIQCDVSSPPEVARMFDYVAEQFPSLNILVNNAGIQHRYDFLNDEDALKKINEEIDINFKAAVSLTRIFLPILAKASEAAIINVSSFLGIVPKSSAPIYCATKAALHSFSKSLRFQLQGTTVKVFDIITPLVDTDMTRGYMDDAGKMSPETLAREVIRSIKKDNYEIKPGKTRLALFLNRVAPSLIQRIMEKR